MFIMQDQDREPLEDITSFGTERRIVESTSQVHVTILAELHRALFPLGIKLDLGLRQRTPIRHSEIPTRQFIMSLSLLEFFKDGPESAGPGNGCP